MYHFIKALVKPLIILLIVLVAQGIRVISRRIKAASKKSRKNARKKPYKKRPKKETDNIVYLSEGILAVGVVSTTIIMIPTIITLCLGRLLISFGFFLFASLGISVIIAFINCRVWYNNDGFTYRTFFGIKRHVTYDQVTAISEYSRETYIYLGKRWFMVDEYSVNGAMFIGMVKKKYHELHNRQAVPRVIHKYDLFKGHIGDTASYLALFILVTVFLLFLVISIPQFIYSPSNETNTIEHSVCFVSCKVKSEEIVLTSSNRQIYKIQAIDNDFDERRIQSICDGRTIVTTYSKKVTPRHSRSFYSIRAIVHNDNQLLSFEETDRLNRQFSAWSLLIMTPFLLAWFAFVFGAIKVGRNPAKYSKRVVNFFFKGKKIRY